MAAKIATALHLSGGLGTPGKASYRVIGFHSVGSMSDTCRTAFVDVDWSGWSKTHILAPVATQAFLTFLFLFVGRVFRKAMDSRWRLRKIVETFIGHASQLEVPRPFLLITVYFLEAVTSAIEVCIWVQHTYWRETTDVTRAIFALCALIDILNWTVIRIQAECETHSLWHVGALVDVLTVVPSLQCGWWPGACDAGEDWLSLHFMRSFSVLISLKRIKRTGILERLVSPRICTVVEAICEILCVVVMIAGAMLTCEILGDPPFLQDSCVQSVSSDPISFMNMVYWTMVSITTVGYGDISPKASLSRILSSFCIVIGVATIFRIQYKFTTIWNTNDEGRGSYHHSSGVHVVFIINVRGRPAQLATMLTGFLHEILHPAHQGNQSGIRGLKTKEARWPNVVVFAPALWDGENHRTFDDYIRSQASLTPEARRKITYVMGKISNPEDLKRAAVGSSMLAFVVSNTDSEDPDEDDGQNIHAALILRDTFPNVRLRLMLLRPESKNLALQAGIEASRCFSIRELKANILAQNVRCHGLVPTISGMFMSADERDNDGGIDLEPWMQTYLQGLQRGVYGFLLSEDLKGKSFGEAAIAIFKATNAILIGIFYKGRLILCPQFTEMAPLQSGQICFAIATRPEDLEPVRLSGDDGEETDWRVSLAHARDSMSRRARSEGVHVAAAKYMRRGIRQEILSKSGSGADPRNSARSILADRPSTRFSKFVEHNTVDASRQLLPYASNQTTDVCDARSTIRLLRENLCETEELVLLIVCNGVVWQQVTTFVSALCADYQPVQRYVVVLAPTAVPHGLFDDFDDRVFSMRGSYTSARLLVAAGLLEARSVVVMSGEPPQEHRLRDPMFQDYQVLLCAQEVECWCGVSAREVFAVFELQNSLSARQLPPLVDKPAVSPEEIFGRPGDTEEDEEVWALDEIPAGKKILSAVLKPMSSTIGVEHLPSCNSHHDGSLIFNPRFAAGQIFTPEVWGVMMGRMFYMPAVIELLEALLMPHLRGQPVFTWQFRVPEIYAGRPFMRLAQDLLDPSEGLFMLEPKEDSKRTPRSSKSSSMLDGPAVPLSILRKRDTLGPRPGKMHMASGTGAYNYNILAPLPTFQMLNGDWVTVLGSKAFGARIHELGLLRGYSDSHPPKSHYQGHAHGSVLSTAPTGEARRPATNGHSAPTSVGSTSVEAAKSTQADMESLRFLPAVPEYANNHSPNCQTRETLY